MTGDFTVDGDPVGRAVADAADAARREVFERTARRWVDEEVRRAATGRTADVVGALLEGVDQARFLDADHEPDRAAIQAWVDRVAPAPVAQFGDPLVQGFRGVPAPGRVDMAAVIRQKVRDGDVEPGPVRYP